MENLPEFRTATSECEFKMDIPGNLPIEVFHEILKYLPPRDLYNVRDCCEKWRYHMQSFWKIKCIKEGYSETEDDLNSQFYQKFMERFSRWEGIYMYNSKLEDNWLNLNYKEVVNTVGLLGQLIIEYFCGDLIIAYLSNYKYIYVINATTAMIEKQFELTFPRGNVITVLHASGKIENKLIAILGMSIIDIYGNIRYPRVINIQIWNIETEEVLPSIKLENINATIKGVLVCKNLIIFSLYDGAVYIYNFNNGAEYTHNCVTSVSHDKDKIAMLYHTGTLAIINLDYTELTTFNCCDAERVIFEIQMNGNYLITLSGSLKEPGLRASIWNIDTKTKLYQVEKLILKGFAVYFRENRLFYVSEDKNQAENLSYKLCALDTGRCILELASGDVRSHNTFVVKRNNEDDCLLKMMCIKTGKSIANVELLQPLPSDFLQKNGKINLQKSKYAFFRYDRRSLRWSLCIMDFEAKIE